MQSYTQHDQSLPEKYGPDGPPRSPLSTELTGVQRTAYVLPRERYSGTGILTLAETQRRDRDAKRILYALIAAVLLVVVVSALLIITPSLYRPGFTPSPNLALLRNTSTPDTQATATPVPATATQAPTPTPPAGPLPTMTVAPIAAVVPTATVTTALQPTATSTPRPTATPVPPTPTAIINGTTAQISFKRTQLPINISQNMTACGGCGVNLANSTIPAAYISVQNAYIPYRWSFSIITVGYVPPVSGAQAHVTLRVQCGRRCTVDAQQGDLLRSSTGVYCSLDITPFTNGSQFYAGCTAVDSAYRSNNELDFSGNGLGPGAIVTSSQVDTNGRDYNPGNPGYQQTIIPYDCKQWGGAGSDVQRLALQYVNNDVNSGGYAIELARGVPSLVGSYYCSDQNGQWHNPGDYVNGSYWSQGQIASNWRFSYDSNQAPVLQQQRLNAAVPSDYYLASQNICSSGSVQNVNAGSQQATISCSANGAAWYLWNAAQQQALQIALRGATLGNARNILASTLGVNPATISISISSNAPSLPLNSNNIILSIANP